MFPAHRRRVGVESSHTFYLAFVIAATSTFFMLVDVLHVGSDESRILTAARPRALSSLIGDRFGVSRTTRQ